MLTLSRKIGERICIGDNIFVVVKDIRGNRVQLGIVAPLEIPILRQELLNGTKGVQAVADSGPVEETIASAG